MKDKTVKAYKHEIDEIEIFLETECLVVKKSKSKKKSEEMKFSTLDDIYNRFHETSMIDPVIGKKRFFKILVAMDKGIDRAHKRIGGENRRIMKNIELR